MEILLCPQREARARRRETEAKAKNSKASASKVRFLFSNRFIFQRLIPPLFLFRVKVLYDYEAQDLDELTIKEGELIDLLKEGRRQHFFKIFPALL